MDNLVASAIDCSKISKQMLSNLTLMPVNILAKSIETSKSHHGGTNVALRPFHLGHETKENEGKTYLVEQPFFPFD